MIKTRCAWCNAKIPGKEAYYEFNGNSCKACSERVGRFVLGIRGRRNGKNFKIRDYTQEEKDRMLMDRIKEVKELGL